jgi:hypothetical protein
MPFPPRTSPWVTSFEMEGIEPFASNLLSLFERDQTPALDWAARGEALEDFEVFNNSRRLNQKWAALSVIPRQEATPLICEGQIIDVGHTVEVQIEDKGPEPNQLVWSVVRRVRAVRAMIWSASIEELTWNMQIENPGLLTVEVTPAIYAGFIDRNKTIYTQYASLSVSLKLNEV